MLRSTILLSSDCQALVQEISVASAPALRLCHSLSIHVCLELSALDSAPIPQAVDINEDAVVDVMPPHDALDHIARLEGVQRFLRAFRSALSQARFITCKQWRCADQLACARTPAKCEMLCTPG